MTLLERRNMSEKPLETRDTPGLGKMMRLPDGMALGFTYHDTQQEIGLKDGKWNRIPSTIPYTPRFKEHPGKVLHSLIKVPVSPNEARYFLTGAKPLRGQEIPDSIYVTEVDNRSKVQELINQGLKVVDPDNIDQVKPR